MKLADTCLIPAGFAETWQYLMDIPAAARCVPGVAQAAPDGPGCYRGELRAKVGPMTLTLAGAVTIQQQDPQSGRARFIIEASDRRVGGGVKTDLQIQLTPLTDNQTQLSIQTDTTFIGRLAELGQPIIRRKAQSTIQEFARNLQKEISAPIGE